MHQQVSFFFKTFIDSRLYLNKTFKIFKITTKNFSVSKQKTELIATIVHRRVNCLQVYAIVCVVSQNNSVVVSPNT